MAKEALSGTQTRDSFFRGRRSFRELKQIAETENDDIKLQDALDSFTPNSLRGFLQLKLLKHQTITTVLRVARDNGYHLRGQSAKSIAEKIEEARIPIVTAPHLDKNGNVRANYYIVYAMHSGRVLEVLRNNPDLQKSR